MFESTKPYITSTEIEYKLNLSKQVDRIAELLSTKLEVGSLNIIIAMSLLVAAQRNSVDALEAMLSPYLDEEYKDELEALYKKYKEKMNNKNEHKAIIAEQNYVEKKFALVMMNMDRENLLMQRSKLALKEGFDSSENVETKPAGRPKREE